MTEQKNSLLFDEKPIYRDGIRLVEIGFHPQPCWCLPEEGVRVFLHPLTGKFLR